MALIFPKWTNEIPKVAPPILLVLGAFATFVVWFWWSPKHTDVGYQPQQPIAYSHKLHAGDLGMDCRYCHHVVERGPHAGVPPTETCMNCHAYVKTDSPLLAPLRKSWREDTPVPWVRIHKVPDYAYFDHSAHLNLAGKQAAVGCKSCHGRVDQMVEVRQVEPLSMTWCLDCHENPAPHLRPIDQVTNMAWTPEQTPGWAGENGRAAEIAQRLNAPGRRDVHRASAQLGKGGEHLIPTAHCSGCHR